MAGFTKAWLIWGSATVASFAAIEGAALATGDMGNTLTAHLRAGLGQDPERPWGTPAALAVFASLSWVAYHLLIDREKKAP